MGSGSNLTSKICLDTGGSILRTSFPPIPWVLTKEEISLVNSRFRRLVVPHGVHAFCTMKEGLLENRTSCWRFVITLNMNTTQNVTSSIHYIHRMVSKLQVFLMLPTMFLGTVPELLSGLSKVVYSIILMSGRVICERKRRQLRF